jgi:hypothetical protein
MYPGIQAKLTPDKAAYIMASSGERVSYRLSPAISTTRSESH